MNQKETSIVIGNLSITAQEALSAVLTIMQRDENFLLKITNEVQATRIRALENGAFKSNGAGDVEQLVGAKEEAESKT